MRGFKLIAMLATLMASMTGKAETTGWLGDAMAIEPGDSGYAPAGGIDYYYEVYGQGEPLLLLHGGLGLGRMFGPVLERLAQTRQVIVVDLQGHGRTADGERPIRLESMGDDMAAVVHHLGHAEVDVMGYSFGAGVALRMAAQQPTSVRKLVLVSAPFAREGWYPEIIESMVQLNGQAAPHMVETPMYQSYAAVAPRPDDFPRLLDKMGEMMRIDYDWSVDVAALNMPVMLVYGDGDMVRPEHIVRFYQLLGGGLKDAGWQREHMPVNRLAILPNLTHYEIGAAPALAETVLPFLAGS